MSPPAQSSVFLFRHESDFSGILSLWQESKGYSQPLNAQFGLDHIQERGGGDGLLDCSSVGWLVGLTYSCSWQRGTSGLFPVPLDLHNLVQQRQEK